MNDDITWRQENERGFDPKAKFFVEYRKEAKDHLCSFIMKH